MRLVLILPAILIVSYLMFKNYAVSPRSSVENEGGYKTVDVLEKVGAVEHLTNETAEIRRQEIEKQSR